MLSKTLFCLSFLSILLSSCKKPNDSKTEVVVDSTSLPSSDSVPTEVISKENNFSFDSTYDYQAAYLAGIKTNKTDLNDSIWSKYGVWMDSSWAKAFRGRYNVMKNWAKNQSFLNSNNKETLFYPFSGADFLNAYVLFPQYKNYILIGLEPVGALPKFDSLDSRHSYLEDVNTSLKDVLHSSFFHTKKMKVHFQKEKINGALPILTIFIKRTGHTIVNIEAVQITPKGEINTFAYDSLSSNSFLSNGAKITFRPYKDTTNTILWFFSQDLSNTGIGKRNGFRCYLDSLNNYFTFVKSASYLMHYGHFSTIKSSILKNASAVFQDDTGIPYKYFEATDWQIQLFGKYAKPVKLFPSSKFSQNDLKLAFENDSTIGKLPFALGYHNVASKTSLLFAKKGNMATLKKD